MLFQALEEEFARQKNEQRKFYYQLSSSPLPEELTNEDEQSLSVNNSS